jgi:signal peptidase I
MVRKRSSGPDFARRKKEVDISLLRQIAGWVAEIIIVAAIAVVLVYFVGLRTSMVGQSMSPTLDAGDEVLVNRFIYKLSDPKPNDLVVFYPNGNQKSHCYIKRVIGVPGDTVQIKNGTVYVNGEPFEEKIETEYIENAELASEEITLQSGEFFVLGDNRNNSEDSRYANIGMVTTDYMVGKAWFCISPRSKFGKIG